MKIRDACLQFARALAAIVAYAFLAAFIWLVGTQLYSWFRTGDWTHIGVNDGLRAVAGTLLREGCRLRSFLLAHALAGCAH